MSILRTIIFSLLYIILPVLIFLIPKELVYPLVIFYLAANILLIVFWYKYLKIQSNFSPFLFSVTYLILALLVYKTKGNHYMNGLIPMTTFFAYCYISKIKYQFRVLNIIFIGFYIFFIYAYFSRLSGLLIRTNNLDDIFEMSSSNSIAISLNILLYIYIILSYYKKDIYENRFIFIFAIINFVLIVIQQSRIGVVVALVNIIIILLIKKWLSYKRIFYLSLFFITFSLGYSYLDTYTHITGEIGLEAYKEDSRGVIQRSFFENITKDNFFYGYPIDQVYYKNQTRVFNVFLRMWNLYTILGFIIIAILLLRRIFNYKKYYFPLIFIVPFILYGMVEEPFFPYYWDFAIYLLLFTRKNQFDASYSMLNK